MEMVTYVMNLAGRDGFVGIYPTPLERQLGRGKKSRARAWALDPIAGTRKKLRTKPTKSWVNEWDRAQIQWGGREW
jgi:hypothetical protein